VATSCGRLHLRIEADNVQKDDQKTRSPRTLWDLEAFVHALTSNYIYMTNGKVPETITSGSTADISHICEFGWFAWVMFRDNMPTFLDDKLILESYLVPTTDVGLALTAYLLNITNPLLATLKKNWYSVVC
jgi:hypothetical protein